MKEFSLWLRIAVALPLMGGVSLTMNDSLAQSQLPRLNLPDSKILEVYKGNWDNTLQPCQVPPNVPGKAKPDPNVEPLRPWKVDVEGHYPGWYPGVDVKHSAAAYLACEKNLAIVLQAWELTKANYLLSDGSVRPMTLYGNPHSVVPETTVDGSKVYYPLRSTGNIDFLLLGDMIFRFSQDRNWLEANLPAMRKAASYLEGWVDDEGLLYSDSYDLDQAVREIDGVAQASACFAFRRLSDLEGVVGNEGGQESAETLANLLAEGADRHFWDESLGYYAEYIAYNNLARGPEVAIHVSSELDSQHPGGKAADGILGMGIDAFNVKTGVAGEHEWAANGETTGASIRIEFKKPVRIGKAVLFNRTDPLLKPAERFSEGLLTFSDNLPAVQVTFNRLDISRAAVSFDPREVSWIAFTGTSMQGEGDGNAGLAEFLVVSADEPYRKVNHGMTDTNFAMIAFGVAKESKIERVWDYFRAHESSFYEVDGLHAPTWIAEKTESYGPGELNRRAPHKDCVAMARTWRYDALMRQRMRDGEGLYQTIAYANALFDRPSGGGKGYFAERYGLGRFQPGDEAEATVPKYAEYPAVYNSTIVQKTLLGLDVDVQGTILIDPCVPTEWYKIGFGQEGCGVLQNHDLGFEYHSEGLKGWVLGPTGNRKLQVHLPPGLAAGQCVVLANEVEIPHAQAGDLVSFDLPLQEGRRASFVVQRSAAP